MKAIGINLHGKLCKSDSTMRKYLDLFAENMLDYVELAICAMGVVDAAAKLDRARFDTLHDIFGSYSLNYTMEVDVGNIADLADPDQGTALLTAKRFVDVAGLLGSKHITFHAGSVPTGIDRGEALNRAACFLKSLLRYAEDGNVMVGVENTNQPKRGIGATANELECLLREVNSAGLGVTLDFGHAFLASKILSFDFIEMIKDLTPHIIHTHFNDNYGVVDEGSPNYGDTMIPPGAGVIPYEEVLGLLAPRYDGVYLMDIKPRGVRYYVEAIKSFRILLSMF